MLILEGKLMAEIRLTAEGVREKEERLEYLKTQGRTNIAEEIKTARSFGDLSENAEYDAALAAQARMEYEIAELEAMLRSVVLIDEENISTDRVNVGATVKVKNMATKKEQEFQIVGSAEANPYEKRISHEAPVGKALVGAKVGDSVDVQTPGGTVTYKVLAIGK